MSTHVESLQLINDRIFPTILGKRLFVDRPASSNAMGYGEVAMFEALLSHLKPDLSVEVGTQAGVTLATISTHSKGTISIDIDPAVKVRLAPSFPTVEFLTGSSHDLLPRLVADFNTRKVTPDFIFVDGDHTAEGVFKDLNAILAIRPTRPMYVLMHDSFNPGCRHGIKSAGWDRSPYCHFVELDFVPGILHPDESCLRQLWGGLGLAVFLPEVRAFPLTVLASLQSMFEAALRQSVYMGAPARH